MRLIDNSNRDGRGRLFMQICTFVCVGGFATALHYACMFALIQGPGWEPAKASAAGFVTSAIFNYMLNARLTFKSERPVQQTAPRFAVVCTLGLLLNHVVLTALLSLGSHPFIGQIIATICVLSWNFLVNAIWTFGKKS